MPDTLGSTDIKKLHFFTLWKELSGKAVLGVSLGSGEFPWNDADGVREHEVGVK